MTEVSQKALEWANLFFISKFTGSSAHKAPQDSSILNCENLGCLTSNLFSLIVSHSYLKKIICNS